MLTPLSIIGPRLTLRMSSPAELKAELQSREHLQRTLGTPLAPDWPPMHWEPGALNWVLERIAAQPGEPFWRPWFVRLNGQSGLVVGTAGCKGPPDEYGMIEIGYSVVTSHWRQGIATEAVGMLIRWARATGRVRRVCAHTLAGDPASGGVLLKNGFASAGIVVDPTDGEVERYERDA